MFYKHFLNTASYKSRSKYYAKKKFFLRQFFSSKMVRTDLRSETAASVEVCFQLNLEVDLVNGQFHEQGSLLITVTTSYSFLSSVIGGPFGV